MIRLIIRFFRYLARRIGLSGGNRRDGNRTPAPAGKWPAPAPGERPDTARKLSGRLGDSQPHSRKLRQAATGEIRSAGSSDGTGAGPFDLLVRDPWTLFFYLEPAAAYAAFGNDASSATCRVEWSADGVHWTVISDEPLRVSDGPVYVKAGMSDCYIRIRIGFNAAAKFESRMESRVARMPRTRAGSGPVVWGTAAELLAAPSVRPDLSPEHEEEPAGTMTVSSGEFQRGQRRRGVAGAHASGGRLWPGPAAGL